MSEAFLNPRREANALRRVSLLIDRLRQDGYAADPDLAILDSGISTLRRAAADGRPVHRNAVEELARAVGSGLPSPCPPQASISDVLRSCVFVETDELLRRLSAA